MAKKRKGILIEHAAMEAVEDSYGEGEVGSPSLVWESGRGLIDVVWLDEDPDLILAIANKISKQGPFIPGDPEAWGAMAEESGRLDCSYLGDPDADYFPADVSSIAAWKKGKKTLYSVWVFVSVKFIEASLPSGAQLARRLRIQEL